ncbi:MAG: 3-oxoadipate enol-lactonase [Rhodocyclaceae bacterium]|nr:3-oxoadipate enol-lactonase [Rhodocyclaceae bacterium]
MPLLKTPRLTLNYRLDGADGAPVLVLSNSLGTDLDMWAVQMPELVRHFRVLRYDTRGHGGSAIVPGPFGVAELGRDVLDLMDGLDIARAHFCGLSMGGMTGMWLGLNAPGRFDRLVLCNTAAKIGTAEQWDLRIARVELAGTVSVAEAVLERWFTPEFMAARPDVVGAARATLESTSAAGYAASCAAVRDMDQRAAIADIRLPTLVIAGTHDLATPPAAGREVARNIPGARYLELDAAHLSNLEQAEQFTAALLEFLR